MVQPRARALRNFIAAKQFVYTGSDGSIIRAFEKAVHDEDWVVVGYLIDSLRLIGDADALQAINSALSSGKHQFVSVLVSQALGDFTSEGTALTQPLLRVLASEADYDTYSRAIMVAKEVLSKTQDPLLIDGIIDLVVRSPENPEDYSALFGNEGTCYRNLESVCRFFKEIAVFVPGGKRKE